MRKSHAHAQGADRAIKVNDNFRAWLAAAALADSLPVMPAPLICKR
jgi:hypothetical protein